MTRCVWQCYSSRVQECCAEWAWRPDTCGTKSCKCYTIKYHAPLYMHIISIISMPWIKSKVLKVSNVNLIRFFSLMFIPFAFLYWLFEPKLAKLFLKLLGNITKYLLWCYRNKSENFIPSYNKSVDKSELIAKVKKSHHINQAFKEVLPFPGRILSSCLSLFFTMYPRVTTLYSSGKI